MIRRGSLKVRLAMSGSRAVPVALVAACPSRSLRQPRRRRGRRSTSRLTGRARSGTYDITTDDDSCTIYADDAWGVYGVASGAIAGHT